MRISDWSSDVCSSDLSGFVAGFGILGGPRLGGGGALGAQLLEQRFAVAFEAAVLGRLDAGLLRGLGDERVELALRAEAQRHRVLGDDVGAGPVAALADRVDRGARRAGQLRSEEHTSELQSQMRI